MSRQQSTRFTPELQPQQLQRQASVRKEQPAIELDDSDLRSNIGWQYHSSKVSPVPPPPRSPPPPHVVAATQRLEEMDADEEDWDHQHKHEAEEEWFKFHRSASHLQVLRQDHDDHWKAHEDKVKSGTYDSRLEHAWIKSHTAEIESNNDEIDTSRYHETHEMMELIDELFTQVQAADGQLQTRTALNAVISALNKLEKTTPADELSDDHHIMRMALEHLLSPDWYHIPARTSRKHMIKLLHEAILAIQQSYVA
jgi:hypothetical protein